MINETQSMPFSESLPTITGPTDRVSVFTILTMPITRVLSSDLTTTERNAVLGTTSMVLVAALNKSRVIAAGRL